MRCPSCGNENDKVVDSRSTRDGSAIRRRRECVKCGHRFTTYEYIERRPVMVIKKDGNRERYSREKILEGLLKACEKRPVSMTALEELIDEVEREMSKKVRDEIPTEELGNAIINRLAKIDQVAYVRFASVYREFKDISQFMDELKGLIGKEG
ncbi:MAG: transcriptional regulator NrdR [Candidatus Krumholzibacteriales bacterium]